MRPCYSRPLSTIPTIPTIPSPSSPTDTHSSIPLPPAKQHSPFISIVNSTFYNRHPSLALPLSLNPPLFPKLTFSLLPHQPYAILAPSPVKSAFLSILRGDLICSPPHGRTYPALNAQHISPASDEGIALVAFGSGRTRELGMLGGGVDGGGYVSARYESLRGVQDVTLQEWLVDGGALNSLGKQVDEQVLHSVVESLRLDDVMLQQPVMTLSNGQVRRAKLAAALLKKPKVVLCDEPFMGLDPPSTHLLSALLEQLPHGNKAVCTTPLVALREHDPVPEWIQNLVYLSGDYRVLSIGRKEDVVNEMQEIYQVEVNTDKLGSFRKELFRRVWGGVDGCGRYESTQVGDPEQDNPLTPITLPTGDSCTSSPPLIILHNVSIIYGTRTDSPRRILHKLDWKIRRGDRWGLFGANGSGKTTLLSLLTSDHPQTYSQDIYLFHPSCRSESRQSTFDIQQRIGQTSPEIHAFFPRHLNIRKVLESAWAETPVSKPLLPTHAKQDIDTVLTCFAYALPQIRKDAFVDKERDGHSVVDDSTPFSDLSVCQQRLLLFLRAIVKRPDLVILDEALSGMEDTVRKHCLQLLEPGMGWLNEEQALVVVSHAEEEIPASVGLWIRLGNVGEEGGAKFGRI